MPSATANFGWLKPDIGASNDQWGSLLNNDLDAIDTQVKANQTAIPAASTTLPLMDGTAAIGVGATWARADHVHASDTSRYAASNPAGYQTAAQVTASLGAYLPLAGGTMTGGLTVAPASGPTGLTIAPLAAGANLYLNGVATQVVLNKSVATNNNLISGQTSGNQRWQIILGNATAEGGSNAGSDFQISAFTDAGASLSTPLTITRSSGNATFSGNVTFSGQTTTSGRIVTNNGYGPRSGSGGPNQSNAFNIDWNTGAHLWIDASNLGQIAFTSDYRIKKDVTDLPSMWDRAKALRPISYTHQDFTPPVELQRDAEAKPLIVDDDVERWGFIAHELQETLIPSAATGEKDSPTHIQSPNPWTVIATLTRALQEAMARIEALEAAGA